MAVRAYRDTQGRARWLVEFAQAGNRILRRCPPGTGKADAQAYETKLRAEIFAAVSLGRTPEISLDEAILRWLRDTLSQKKDRRKPPQNALLLAPFTAGKSLRQAPEAARMAVSTWTVRGNSPPLSPATINRRLCVLKAALRHAYKQGWIADNLSGRITLLPGVGRREVYLTAAQVRQLAAMASDGKISTAIMIAAYSGLRASELLALKQTTTQSDSLTVPASVSKTGKPRHIPIVSLLRPHLRALPLGLSYWQLRGGFDKARKAAGMPHVHFHDLRHTCASLLINEGVDLYVVGAILGHSSPATTSRYAHLSQATLRKAMNKLR